MFPKNFVRRHFPRTLMFLHKVKDRISVECRVLKRLGLKSLLQSIIGASSYCQEKLPVQEPRFCKIAGLEFSSFQDILGGLKNRAISFSEGRHSCYLSPEQWKISVFAPLAGDYPASAGLKIMKRLGGLEIPYQLKSESVIQERCVPSHRHQSLTINGLHILGITPRLYDLLEIDGGENRCAAYVIQHIEGKTPPLAESEAVVNQLKSLVNDNTLELINKGGFAHMDFQCPGCNGNAIKDKDTGQVYYVDVQNFKFVRYDCFLKDLALKARRDSHFGDSSILLGGRYLYQAIPGLSMPAKRDPEKRFEAVLSLLEGCNVSIDGKIVLDIGCNIGLTSAQYLKHGAKWIHGWDLERVIGHTRRVLLGIGCTRFSLTGRVLSDDSDIKKDIPHHIGEEEVIISYLAVRQHIGWIKDLAHINWKHMIYEGHQGESEAATIQYFKELEGIAKVRVLAQGTVEDANSAKRVIAVLERQDHASTH